MTAAKKKPLTKPHPIHAELRDAAACPEARGWARGKTPATIWRTCGRGDWMLWWAGRCAGPPGDEARRTLTLAACACARIALPIWKSRYPSDKRLRAAIETAEAWARGDDGATLDAVRAAATAAAASAYASAAAAYCSDLRECADIVRRYYPKMPRMPK